jgi:hypothetical protein
MAQVTAVGAVAGEVGAWNRPLYASAALGMGGYGVGMAAFGCYPTFDYSTGWNQFCPGTGFVFGTGQIHQ